MRNEQSVEIDRPIAEVFDFTLKNTVKWVEIVVEDELVEDKNDGGVGTTFHVVTVEKGRGYVSAEAIVTTEAKAKALRPVAEKMITKAKKGGLHNHRQLLAFVGDQEIVDKLMEDVGPRYANRPGGYTRILRMGPRHGDNAPMARIELV